MPNSKSKIVVLGGAGAMGQVTTEDLSITAEESEIVVADLNLEAAKNVCSRIKDKNVRPEKADLRNQDAMVALLKGCQVVINASPYYFNREVMKAALLAKCHYVDLGGLYHETLRQLELDTDFRKSELVAVLGMGSTPGTTNVMTAAAAAQFDTIRDIGIYCAGEEIETPNNNSYQHPFYPPYMLDTILDEYTMEAILFKDGALKKVKPISKEETLDFGKRIGIQAVIPTIHSELATIPNSYKNKGIQNVFFKLALGQEFHEKLKFLVELGFGSKEPVKTSSGQFYPREILTAMINKLPKPQESSEDCEILRVVVTGTKNGAVQKITMDALATSDDVEELKSYTASGADLNTGVPPSIVAQMICNETMIESKGVLPPELCIEPQQYFEELAKRNIIVSKDLQLVSGCL